MGYARTEGKDVGCSPVRPCRYVVLRIATRLLVNFHVYRGISKFYVERTVVVQWEMLGIENRRPSVRFREFHLSKHASVIRD